MGPIYLSLFNTLLSRRPDLMTPATPGAETWDQRLAVKLIFLVNSSPG